jgi:MerR family transcriptional regulator, heat shock protein HspR
MNAGRLDDEDHPSVTMGQAAELLDVQPALLRVDTSRTRAGTARPTTRGA